nr:hypothetical protein [Deltaproteobacteria bacterium]
MGGSHDHHDEDETEGPVILAVSDRHPRSRTIQVVRPEPQDTTFLAATAKGLGITLKHFARNFFLPLKSAKDRAALGAPHDEK